MIDLVKFYNDHHSGYYGRFASHMVDFEYMFSDVRDIKDAFRNICMPVSTYSPSKNISFVLLCFWLYKNGYSIKEFPNMLYRPTSLDDFAYGDMRRYLIKRDGLSGTVTWANRRQLCDELTIISSGKFQEVPDEIEKIIVEISTRGAAFDSMAVDEKLELLNNLIENLLKRDGKYLSLNYTDIFFGSFSKEQVKEYRQKTHCFRHGAMESIELRKKLSEHEKDYLVDLGVFLIIHLYKYTLNIPSTAKE